ncbi:MAG: hypothetical protein JO299_11115 [Gammaproteobacteria bacterium]|nr:hypothetical protein [Gammaproteobacteria bacterium]
MQVITDGSLEQRATQDLTSDRKIAEEALASANHLIMSRRNDDQIRRQSATDSYAKFFAGLALVAGGSRLREYPSVRAVPWRNGHGNGGTKAANFAPESS